MIFTLTTFSCQKEEIESYKERVKRLLEITPPKGKDFLHKVEHILEREKNWVRIPLSLAPWNMNTSVFEV